MDTADHSRWYSFWFDSPYYHILYKDRDMEEASAFMKRLVSFLDLAPDSSILDLACGRGRHSIYLNKLGYRVTGVDLSKENIQWARQYEKDGLEFKVHNMCDPLPQQYDAVFNLFTSFGYFESEGQDLQTLHAIRDELKAGGVGVIDFMNAERVRDELVPSETKEIDGIVFHISKRFEDGHIIKDIHFEDRQRSFNFSERVKSLTLDDFERYFATAGLRLTHTFGTYELSAYNRESSDRLIMIFEPAT